MEGIVYDAAERQSKSDADVSIPQPGSSLSSSRKSSRQNSPNLSLDLSDLPPLITPSPESNTLLITNLMDPSIFQPASLATIRQNISQTATLHSFSPLKSFRRIVVSFYSIEDAITIRSQLDGENILGHRVRVFFGAPTRIDATEKQQLSVPNADKLFFISPPPSPPHGWEMRNEEPPNKDVHADDLAAALSKLHAKTNNPASGFFTTGHEDAGMPASPVSPTRTESEGVIGNNASSAPARGMNRMRSGSTTLVYHPDHHGDSPMLPAVMVEDTTVEAGSGDPEASQDEDKKIMAHTARPPVELMDQS